MNQYKPIFLGQVDPAHPLAKLKRATNSQKCIRAGGKHNDLDDVGKDVYHHTFFEMLGNWSFGDYFKKEAIEWSFELLTKVYGLDPSRLYASYFGGDPSQNLPPDHDARDIWLNLLPPERVLPFDCKDNFWEMGDVGPCGPCSEIHYDRVGNRDASDRVNADFPDVIEIWNIVFIQFNRKPDATLDRLPQCHIDTGMGFERLASILQGHTSNYDTDVFQPLFGQIQELTKAQTYQGKIGLEDPDNIDMAYRVVADHIRTLTFAITDGAVPSNDGRGYVLRRILRRAVRYGQQILNAPTGFLTKLIPTVVTMLSPAFPELAEKQQFVEEIVLDEELSFGKTLNKGIERFNKTAAKILAAKDNTNNVVSGEDAFFLYDTMGFPIDLTQLMAEEKGLTVDLEGYERAMKTQKDLSKSDRKKVGQLSGGKQLVLEAKETSYLTNTRKISTTDDELKYEWNIKPQATIMAIFTPKGEFVHQAGVGAQVGIILNQTSFYAQSGGQVSDTGILLSKDTSIRVRIESVESYAGYVLHQGVIESGQLSLTQDKARVVECIVDYDRRQAIAPNHTMTHVLNFALRQVLTNTAVDQRGSLVDEHKLRFDFTNNKPLKVSQIEKAEDICRDVITRALPVYTQVAKQAEAKRIQGLRAVFGETYPEFVRVISVGQDIPEMLLDPEKQDWSQYSVEFCGGTHVGNTAEARAFALVEENGIAKGIRRIVALTGARASEAQGRAKALEAQVQALDATKEVGPALISKVAELTPQLDQAVISLVQKDILRRALGKTVDRIKKYKKAQGVERSKAGLVRAKEAAIKALASGQAYVLVQLDDVGTDAKLGREMLQTMNAEHPEGHFMILSTDVDKKQTACFCQIPDSSAKDARKWVNHAMSVIGGKGGGKDPLNATGQAKTIENLDQVLALAKEYITSS